MRSAFCSSYNPSFSPSQRQVYHAQAGALTTTMTKTYRRDSNKNIRPRPVPAPPYPSAKPSDSSSSSTSPISCSTQVDVDSQPSANVLKSSKHKNPGQPFQERPNQSTQQPIRPKILEQLRPAVCPTCGSQEHSRSPQNSPRPRFTNKWVQGKTNRLPRLSNDASMPTMPIIFGRDAEIEGDNLALRLAMAAVGYVSCPTPWSKAVT